MPKQLYGKSSKRRPGSQRVDDDSLWLTLIASIDENSLHGLCVKALQDPRAPSGIAAELLDALAASLIEYAAGRTPDCDEAWVGLVQELFVDFGLCLREPDEGEEASVAERDGAVELVGCLKRHKVLCAEPPPPPPLQIGDAVVAVLEEDGEWHEAVVVQKLPNGGDRPPRVAVRFIEWPKVQETARTAVISLAEVPDDDDDGGSGDISRADEGACELCGRCMKLTFHHVREQF